ncbi:ester cyclase [Salinigranum sp.]|uniref:ester cyclase n=1 Tax=Salinigranum sp. TaxID=1966351 RepID=UPI00356863D6
MSDRTRDAERPTTNAECVARAYVETWNEQAYERIPDLVSESFVHVDPDGEEFHGREGLEGFMRAVEVGFSDFHVDVTELLADAGVVMYRGVLRMTHDGEFQGVPPTGERFEIPEMATVRVVDGVVSEHRVYYDKGAVQNRLASAEA